MSCVISMVVAAATKTQPSMELDLPRQALCGSPGTGGESLLSPVLPGSAGLLALYPAFERPGAVSGMIKRETAKAMKFSRAVHTHGNKYGLRNSAQQRVLVKAVKCFPRISSLSNYAYVQCFLKCNLGSSEGM